jgi:hypothetical protein
MNAQEPDEPEGDAAAKACLGDGSVGVGIVMTAAKFRPGT